MRATCEFSEKKSLSSLPSVRVRIYKTRKDITIKISDLGGGIDRASCAKIFNYMYSTAPQVSAHVFIKFYVLGLAMDLFFGQFSFD